MITNLIRPQFMKVDSSCSRRIRIRINHQSPIFFDRQNSHRRVLFVDRFSEVLIQNDLKPCAFCGKNHLESQIAINYHLILSQPTLAPKGVRSESSPQATFQVPRTVQLMAEVGRETEIWERGFRVSRLRSEYNLGTPQNDDLYISFQGKKTYPCD